MQPGRAPFCSKKQGSGLEPFDEARAVSAGLRQDESSRGKWNTAWDPFVELDPVWTDEFICTGVGIYGSGLFSPKEIELLSIAFDASCMRRRRRATTEKRAANFVCSK
jgi:hypothetical protein